MDTKTAEALLAALTRSPEAPALAADLSPEERRRRQYEQTMHVHSEVKPRAAAELLALLGPESYLDESRILLALDNSPHDFPRGGQTIHTLGMMDRLARMPDQFADVLQPAREAARGLRAEGLDRVRVYGLGGSAAPAGIAGEILANAGCDRLEFEVVRRDAPDFDGADARTLLVFCSFSGETEETLNCVDLALRAGCATNRMVALSVGGTLKQRAEADGIAWLQLPHYILQPRESAAYQIVALLGLVSELRIGRGSSLDAPFSLREADLESAASMLKTLTAGLHWTVPFRDNSAKQVAAQLLCGPGDQEAGGPRAEGARPLRSPLVMSSASCAAVAYELYTQFCEASKVMCHVAAYPEALHNLVESMKFSLASDGACRWSLYFLESDDDEPRVAQRWRHTLEQIFPGVHPSSFRTTGKTAFERSLRAYCFNAWMRLYAAFLNGAEPLPVPTMSYMKDYMHGIPRE